MSRVSCGVVLSLLALAPPLRADVHVVDPQGGPGAALLQAAINTSQPGDILLLRAGDYSAASVATLQGKALTLVADGGADITLPGLDITGVPKGQTVLVRGLNFVAPPAGGRFNATGLGSLWVEDCQAIGRDAWLDATSTTQFAFEGLFTQNLDVVVVARSSFIGGRGLDAGTGSSGATIEATRGAAGLSATTAKNCALEDVTATGGRGGDGPYLDPFGSDGGPGVQAGGEVLALQGGALTGGDEGENNDATVSPGSGLAIAFGTAHVRGTSFTPGAVHGLGTEAPPISTLFATVSEDPQPARLLAIDSPVREFGHAGVHVAGEAGDLAWLFVSTAPGSKWMPSRAGLFVLDLSLPIEALLLGATDGTGQLEADALLPALPAGTDGLVLFTQLAVIHGGTALLGTASSVVWVSAVY